MSTEAPTPKFRPRSYLTVRRFDDELVVMDAHENVVRILNEVGSRIWQLADGTRDARQVAEALVSEYDVPLDVAEMAVHNFLQELMSRHLLEPVS